MPDDAAGGAAGEVGAEPVVVPQAVHRQGAHQDHHASPGQMGIIDGQGHSVGQHYLLSMN